MKTSIQSLSTITLILVAFAVLPKTQAVVPPPDGGYPGANTAEGENALLSLTTGAFNTAVGFFALENNDLGNYNTAIGAGALFATADSVMNTAVGAGALLLNTGGTNNTATGAFALINNRFGTGNTAIGNQALQDARWRLKQSCFRQERRVAARKWWRQPLHRRGRWNHQ